MNPATVSHAQFNVKPEHLPFYRDLLTFLGWNISHDGDGMVMVERPGGETFAFMGIANDASNDYDGPGLNHLAFGVASIADVDAACAFLTERQVPLLFDTPRHRPDFVGDDAIYYQVMFETSDRLLIEIVHAGPR